MVNALDLATRFHAAMPEKEVPEQTAGYEGFFHLHNIKGSVDKAELHYIIRDFDREHFEARKQAVKTLADKLSNGLQRAVLSRCRLMTAISICAKSGSASAYY